MPTNLKVAIIEDQPRIRAVLRLLIDGTEGDSCTAVYPSMEEPLSRIGSELSDVVLVDIGLPGTSGIDASAR
jgi:CheY-like chemotaxis protein